MELMLGIVLGAAFGLLVAVWYARYRKGGIVRRDALSLSSRNDYASNLPLVPVAPQSSGTDLEVVDANGNVLVRTREIAGFPAETRAMGHSDVALSRGRQLAADLFKGVATLPGKTVEVVFDPMVIQGFQNGTLEIVPAAKGGTYAMARNVGTGRTAGHGRLIESGGARQLAAGLFHVASIAVAQSHLADINRSLEDIKGLTRDVKRYMTDKDLAELEGGIAYLQELAAMLGRLDDPAGIPAEKRNQLETLRRKTKTWMPFVRRQCLALGEKIAAQTSRDWMGTGSTNEALLGHVDEAQEIVAMYQLVLQLTAMTEACDAYIDPTRHFNPGATLVADSQELMAMLSSMLMGLRDRTNNLLGQAVGNREETLAARRKQIIDRQERLLGSSQESHAGFAGLLKALEKRSRRAHSSDEGVRMLLSFDEHGSIDAMAVR